MSNFNMTGENYPHNFDGDLSQLKKDKESEPYKLGIGAIILFGLFAVLIVTILIQDNTNDRLRAEIAEQDTLINHLEIVLDDDLMMHHQKHSK